MIRRLVVLWSCSLVIGCSRPSPETVGWEVMGTYAALTVPHEEALSLPTHSNMAATVMAAFERDLSLWTDTSELSSINAAAGRGAVPVSPRTQWVVETSLAFAESTRGAFDPTVAPLVKLWGFGGGTIPRTVPDEAALSAVRARVGFRHVVVSHGTVTLAKPGIMLDVGGVAKGCAVDVCYQQFVDGGVSNIMVNLGGNIRCRGEAAPGSPWRIGVRNPFRRSDIIGALTLPDGMAIATSGNYERFVVVAGKRYAHIMDPRSGQPVEGMAGVTVLSPSAAEADALSTALFVLGREAGKAVLAEHPGSHALFVPDEQPLRGWVSEGFGERFKPRPGLRVEPL